MSSPELNRVPKSASPAALGSVFRTTAPWLQEHGTVTEGQILDPSDSDDLAPSYEFDGQVICTLLPEAAALLDIQPNATLSCGFWPAYPEPPNTKAEEIIIMPPECGFYITYKDDSAVVFTIHLDVDSDEWLGNGRKRVDQDAWVLTETIPPDPISREECKALQTIADNLNLLKQAQETR